MRVTQRLQALARSLKHDFHVYRLVLQDPRTPRVAKVLLGLGVGYALLPFDLIPDWLPIVGQLDDVIIVPLLIAAGLRFVPPAVIAACRAKAAATSASAERCRLNAD